MPYIILSLQLQLFFKQDSQKKYYIHFSDFTYFIYFLSSQSFTICSFFFPITKYNP